jgi:hypothetical protein
MKDEFGQATAGGGGGGGSARAGGRISGDPVFNLP